MFTSKCYSLQALQSFTEWQFKDIMALGSTYPVLEADQAEHLGSLASQTKYIINIMANYSENLRLIQQWMLSFQRLYAAASKRLQETLICLQRVATSRDPMCFQQALQQCEVSLKKIR